MHTLVERKLALEKNKLATCSELVEAIINSPFDFDLLCALTLSKIHNEEISLKELLSSTNARLHRSVGIADMINALKLLLFLLDSFPIIEEGVLGILNVHPDLIPLLLTQCGDASETLITSGLEDWVKLSISTPRRSFSAWKDTVGKLLLYKLNHCSNLIACYLRNLVVKGEDPWNFYIIGVDFIMKAKIGHCFSKDDIIAVLDFALQLKSVDKTIPCDDIILFTVHQVPLSIFSSLPQLTRRESYLLLQNLGSKHDYLSALLHLANYPYSNENNMNIEQVFLAIAACARPLDLSFNIIVKDHSLALLLAASQTENSLQLFYPLEDDYLHAHVCFLHYAQRLLSGMEPGCLAKLTSIAKAHPSQAQRLLLLISHTLNRCTSRQLLIEIITALIQVTSIDKFCQDRSLSLLCHLVQNSYLLRATILPMICSFVSKMPYLFDLVREYLASLLHSSSATRSGIRAFAICVLRISRLDNRQSYLKFAFSTIQGVLSSNFNQSQELDANSMTLLLLALETLVNSQFINPKLGTLDLISL